MDSIVFTPASLIDLLSKIEELSDYPIGITETLDGQIQLNVGFILLQMSLQRLELALCTNLIS